MICPACNSDMIVVEYQRTELDYCPHCSGVWFDTGELELMLTSAEISDKFPGDLNRLPVAKTKEAERRCPICRKGMSKNSIGTKPSIVVDVCRRGDGLFFDGGEVHMLIKQLPGVTADNPIVNFLSTVFKSPD